MPARPVQARFRRAGGHARQLRNLTERPPREVKQVQKLLFVLRKARNGAVERDQLLALDRINWSPDYIITHCAPHRVVKKVRDRVENR